MPTTRPLALLPILLLHALLSAQQPGTQQPGTPKPGTTERTLEVGGTQRDYLLHIPPGFPAKDQQPAPLVIMLHGRTSNGKAAASSYYGWTKLADEQNFVAAFPTALGQPTSWELARDAQETRDTQFLAQLIDSLVAELHLDRDRIFLTGHSSGAFMSYSFAAMHADKVAAIGPVAGLVIRREAPRLPVPVIAFHGMADEVVAYDPEHGKKAAYRGLASALESAAAFAKYDGCGAEPKRTELHDGKVHLDTWSAGKDGAQVQLYSLEGWGHGWPNEKAAVAATQLIWQFFAAHARKPSPVQPPTHAEPAKSPK